MSETGGTCANSRNGGTILTSLAFRAIRAFLAPVTPRLFKWHPSCSFHYREHHPRQDQMTRAQWLAIGAVALGIAIVVYLVFFCPEECH